MQIDLRSMIHEILKPYGFKRRSSTWYLDYPDCTAVINLQRSQWSASFYLNIGVRFKSLDQPMEHPKEYDCHLRRRLEETAPNLLVDALDLEKTMPDAERRDVLESHLINIALPLLENCSTYEGAKSAMDKGLFQKHFATKSLKMALGLDAK